MSECKYTMYFTDLPFKPDIMLISTLSDDINEIIGQNKWNPFPFHTKFALKVSKKVSKVNVKKLQRNLLVTAHWEKQKFTNISRLG